jgi:hypothetical protein
MTIYLCVLLKTDAHTLIYSHLFLSFSLGLLRVLAAPYNLTHGNTRFGAAVVIVLSGGKFMRCHRRDS